MKKNYTKDGKLDNVVYSNDIPLERSERSERSDRPEKPWKGKTSRTAGYRPEQTLFKSFNDYRDADRILKMILRGLGNIESDDKGFKSVDACASQMTIENLDLHYVDRNHIVELHMRDRDQLIELSGDLVRERAEENIEPPDKLYFGTLGHLKSKMMRSGIKSFTKKYIRLYAEEDRALDFAKKFEDMDSGRTGTIAIPIDAKAAFLGGVKFGDGRQDGEYVTEQISPRFILEAAEGEEFDVR